MNFVSPSGWGKTHGPVEAHRLGSVGDSTFVFGSSTFVTTPIETPIREIVFGNRGLAMPKRKKMTEPSAEIRRQFALEPFARGRLLALEEHGGGMKQMNQQTILKVMLILTIAGLMSACARTFTTEDPWAVPRFVKEDVVSASVFTAPEAPVEPVHTVVTMSTDMVQYDIGYVCSNNRTNAVGTNLKKVITERSSVVLKITRKVSFGQNELSVAPGADDEYWGRGYNVSNLICTISNSSIGSDLLNRRKFTVDLAPCHLDANQMYSFFLVDSRRSDAELAQQKGVLATWSNYGKKRALADVDILYRAKQVETGTSKPGILLAINSAEAQSNSAGQAVKIAGGTPIGRNEGEETTAAECDSTDSPLMVLMKNEAGPSHISLSSLTEGILFNLLGIINDNVKVHQSWIRQDNLYFLTKPDANGAIGGIDQLFGNNTRGPDGKLAQNGYLALAKFDGTDAGGTRRIGRADWKIDSNDPVFGELRLWNDANRDGIAQKTELFSLAEKNIVMLDLAFDSTYAETDAYGNQIQMKSVVKTGDGAMHPMFDVWFRHY